MFVLSATWIGIIAAVTLGHWLLPERWRGWGLIAAAAGFLGYYSPLSFLILIAFFIILHGLAAKYERITGWRLVALIIFFGSILCAFKIHAASAFGYSIDNASFGDFVIPLGLSYYTLRCIHYGIEKYKGAIPNHTAPQLAEYLFFLPTLIAGPIHRFPDFHRDQSRKRWDRTMFAEGLERIIYGLFKISFLANFLVSFQLETVIMSLESAHPQLAAYLTMIQMGLNIYFQFAGYSDMAIGFGLLLGYRVMENFNNPFAARNISELWTRWHMSLTSWCRDYIYMGVIATARSRWLATLTAMIVLGIWHEFSLRYLLWGVYNGAGIVIWQEFQRLKPHVPQIQNTLALKCAEYGSLLLTFHFFMAGLVIVRHDTLAGAWAHWMQIAGLG